MRVILTGATGFLGLPALGILTDRGHDVLVLSRPLAERSCPAQCVGMNQI
jgi:nucleoside-diphosphate-sugar epimerase